MNKHETQKPHLSLFNSSAAVIIFQKIPGTRVSAIGTPFGLLEQSLQLYLERPLGLLERALAQMERPKGSLAALVLFVGRR